MSIALLIGKTLKAITIAEDKKEVLFETEDGLKFKMYHEQDCCEYVYLDQYNEEELKHLIGQKVLSADDISKNCLTCSESGTWTFYTIRTIKDTVVLRWLGESNGYYSETVDFKQIN